MLPSPSSCVLFGARCPCFWQPFWPRQKSDHFAVLLCTFLVWARVAPFSLSCGGGGSLLFPCLAVVVLFVCLSVLWCVFCLPSPSSCVLLGARCPCFWQPFGQNRKVIISLFYFALFWFGQGWSPSPCLVMGVGLSCFSTLRLLCSCCFLCLVVGVLFALSLFMCSFWGQMFLLLAADLAKTEK